MIRIFSVPKLLQQRDATTPTPTLQFQAPFANATMQSLWPYNTYRPVTWDRYYVNDHYEKHVNVSSGVAAGITVGIFFVVFVLTFGCRIYSQYIDRDQSSANQNSESMMSESLASDMWICGRPSGPPPPYEVAILMPSSPPCPIAHV
ncbi:unnamed protein product [Caenorhabditis auriculariae]|uniref:Uncharacterized protein n=1 Tax=Caenorhabditis auriculariae TaxID=2777116 RepID=A0A8S1HPC6_9PELO|nr:unnamed protein product [Caenorhabditis auriculariae]